MTIPLLFIGYVSSKSVKELHAMFDVITEEMLQPGEHTDGKFVFKVPGMMNMDVMESAICLAIADVVT